MFFKLSVYALEKHLISEHCEPSIQYVEPPTTNHKYEYSCLECNKVFHNKSNLNRHMRNIHRKKNYQNHCRDQVPKNDLVDNKLCNQLEQSKVMFISGEGWFKMTSISESEAKRLLDSETEKKGSQNLEDNMSSPTKPTSPLQKSFNASTHTNFFNQHDIFTQADLKLFSENPFQDAQTHTNRLVQFDVATEIDPILASAVDNYSSSATQTFFNDIRDI